LLSNKPRNLLTFAALLLGLTISNMADVTEFVNTCSEVKSATFDPDKFNPHLNNKTIRHYFPRQFKYGECVKLKGLFSCI